jgi:hypothetical protein
MKKLLLILAFAQAGLCIAQPTITRNDAPVAGDLNVQAIDTLPGINVGPAGATAQTWDFIDLRPHLLNREEYVNPASTQNASDFPTSNLAIGMVGGNTNYLQVDNSAYKVLGFAGIGLTGPTVAKFNPVQTLMHFPATLNSSFKDTSGYRIVSYVGQMFMGLQIDSVRVINRTYDDVTYDAHGKMTTIEGTYNNTLRQKKLTTSLDTIDAYVILFPGFGTWQNFQADSTVTLTYSWFSNNLHFPVASITMDSIFAAPSIARFYFTGPYAEDDTARTPVNTARIITVQDNDAAADSMTTGIISGPSHGSVQVLDKDSLYYVPDSNWVGLDTVVYSVCRNNGRCDTATLYLEVYGTVVSVKSSARSISRVFPNPARDVVNIELTQSAAGGRILIHDMLGREVETVTELSGPLVRIPVSSYSKGIYLFRVLNSRGEVTSNGRFSVVR